MDRALADPMAVDGLQYCYFPVLRTVMRSEVRVRAWPVVGTKGGGEATHPYAIPPHCTTHTQPATLATRVAAWLHNGGGAHSSDGTLDLPEANSRAYWTAVHPFSLSRTAYLALIRFFTNNPSVEVSQMGAAASAYLFMAWPGVYPVGKAMPTQPEVYTGEW